MKNILALFTGLTIWLARYADGSVVSHPLLVEKQVGRDGASTVFTMFNTSPESPDGQAIFHVRFKQEPDKTHPHAPGELWVCSHNLTDYRKVTNIRSMEAHNGAEAQWIDNQRIALLDSGLIRIIDIRTGKDLLKKQVKTVGLGHDSFQHKILFGVDQRIEGEAGVYELNCDTQVIRTLIRLRDCANAMLPTYLTPAERWPVADWRVYHCQYSPDGQKVDFRLDVGKTERAQVSGLCNIDGSGFEVQDKPLHQQWYDANSLIGHIRFDKNGNAPKPDERYRLMRWDRKGNYIETLGPSGNHLATSADRKYFVSETFYKTNPVIVSLIPNGHPEKISEITRFNPYDVTWERHFHVNPAFSRDGKRLYYSKPLNEHNNGTFFCELE